MVLRLPASAPEPILICMPAPGARLMRSRDRVIAGVCGGIANYFGWDPTLVRVGYILLSVVSAAFPGILVYIVLWIVMPEE